MSCLNLPASLQNFSVPLYLPKRQECSYSCQDNFSHALASTSSGPLFNHLLCLAFPNSLSWQLPLYLEIYSSFSPAQKHSLFCYTYTLCSVNKALRSFTANPFERPAHTPCFLFLTNHSCKPLQPGLWPHHPGKLGAPRSSVLSKAPNPQRFLSYYPPEPLHST